MSTITGEAAKEGRCASVVDESSADVQTRFQAGSETDGHPSLLSVVAQDRVRRLVSIILPVYNEAGILRVNVAQILAYLRNLEDRYSFEILIINDGSKDGSGQIAEALAEEHDIVRVLHHACNFGLGQALKCGFAASRGDYVIVLDVDLSYEPAHIGLLLDRITSTRARLVLASPYMEGGQVTNVPTFRRIFSVWGNRFLRTFARGNVSTLTCMVRAYDGLFLRSLVLRSTGMDLMPEVIYKTMILRGRIEEVPAHLDWSKQVAAGVRRASSMRILGHILSTVLSGFFFRPFMFLVLPGLALLGVSAYVNFWMFIHLFEAYLAQPVGARHMSAAYAAAFAANPHTFIVSLLSLLLAILVIGLGVLALQSQKYFEELFYVSTEIRKSLLSASAGASVTGHGRR